MNDPGDGDSDKRRGAGAVGRPIAAKKPRVIPGYLYAYVNQSLPWRTPLATIIGFVETLRGAAKDDVAAQEKFLGIVHVQAKRMARLIDDLLSLSRIELKEHIAPTTPVDMGMVVRDVSFALSELARENGIDLTVSVADTPAFVAGDHDERRIALHIGLRRFENAHLLALGHHPGEAALDAGNDAVAQAPRLPVSWCRSSRSACRPPRRRR